MPIEFASEKEQNSRFAPRNDSCYCSSFHLLSTSLTSTSARLSTPKLEPA